jgi:6-phosphogluconate dehydrogenase
MLNTGGRSQRLLWTNTGTKDPKASDIALLDSPDLAKLARRVPDSGECRWTIAAAIDESVPAPVLGASLYERISSRGEGDFADKVLSALRYQFGGHEEKAAETKKVA